MSSQLWFPAKKFVGDEQAHKTNLLVAESWSRKHIEEADVHHATSHAHDGTDGSGTVAHSSTTGQTVNDHHAEIHKADKHQSVSVRAFRASNLTVLTTSGDMAIGFGGETWDTDGLHDTATNTTRFTVPTGMGGRWGMRYFVRCSADAASNRRTTIKFRKNGVTDLSSFNGVGTTSGSYSLGHMDFFNLVAGDYIEVLVNALGEDRVLEGGETIHAVVFWYDGT